MASVQYEKNEEIATQLSFEEKASLDEIIKHAECSLESQELLDQSGLMSQTKEPQSFAGAIQNFAGHSSCRLSVMPTQKFAGHGFVPVAALNNKTKGPLSVMNSKKFSGSIVKNFPNPLEGTDTFIISSMTDKGVKVAVVYSGKNKANVDCGWLLAFGHTKATGMRIYVECGRKDKFKYISWEQVEKNLDKAGTVAKRSHKETGTSLYAVIVSTGGKSFVGAAFRG